MLVLTFVGFIFVSLGGGNAYDPHRAPQNQGNAFSQSDSWSSSSHRSSSSYSSSSSEGTTPENKRCGENAAYTRCPNPCPRICGNPIGVSNCHRKCHSYGCECDPGYVVSENGKCVKLENCPDYLRCNDRNATFKECPNPCPGTCAFPGRAPCDKTCVKNGCECKQGFYLNDKKKCVQLQDCPGAKTCSANESFVFCKAGCPTNNCPVDDNRGVIACSPPFPCGSGCACRNGYLRNTEDLCILYSDCPPINCTRPNEVYNSHPPPCIFESCTDIGNPQECTRPYPSRPQCVCMAGFYRNQDDICVTQEQCYPPACGYNEVFSECKITCPRQACNSTFTSYLCSNETVCEAGCDCLNGHLRNESDICVPSEECFPAPPCDIAPECRSTCANPKPNCALGLPETQENKDGCKCRLGYILSDTDGVCIRIQDCPDTGCNGDPNAIVTMSPWPSPSTCDSPNAGSYGKTGDEIGCQCKPGFIRSNCGCKCILPDDCHSPVTCTRPNEVWNPCASECLAESCNDLISTPECYPVPENCQPHCVCSEGYYRNASGICVPKADCPINCEIQQECRPTCAVPNPPNCPFIPPSNTNVDCCNCQAGFILSVAGGKCIKVEECPANQSCNSDPNATIKECPLPCPSTCESPDAMPCEMMCDPIGCECKPGYLKSRTGKCILPDECEGGNPCGKNATFVACRYQCPTSYCPINDRRGLIICETFPFAPCYSGCSCRLNHKQRSTEDPRCIVSSECPPVDCSRQHEEWDPCPSPCGSEYCDAVDLSPTPCHTLVLNCDPKCKCRKSYFRNDAGICVSSRECRRLNKQK